MAGYWTNFVKTGDPNGGALPTWPAFGDGGRVMLLGTPVRAGDVPNRTSLDVFDAVYSAVRGKPFGER
jgi:para-nitrobenzyl esterase